MKRFLICSISMLFALGMQADDYHPFVEKGKYWYVHRFNFITNEHDVVWCSFSADKSLISIDGHEYLPMTSSKAAGREYLDSDRWGEETTVGLFREENKKVYFRQSADEAEQLVYDFSLNVGDEFKFPPEMADEAIMEVTAVGKTILGGSTLKTISFNTVGEPTWIEGIGYTSSPLGFMPIPPNGDHYVTAYVGGRTSYLPLTFSEPYLGWWGTDLTRVRRLDTGFSGYPANDSDSISYELVPDPEHNGELSLHVSGQMWTHGGAHNYIYCVCNPEEDSDVKHIRLIQEPLSLTEEIGFYQVDFSFPHFPKGNYIAVDHQGEHQVTISNGTDYRPFIEEGKVWKVGRCPAGGTHATELAYYYFEGDTVIDGRNCKKMKCWHEKIEASPWTEYVGAWYENERRVYGVFPNTDEFMLLYDFGSEQGATIEIYNGEANYLRAKTTATILEQDDHYYEFFKGRVTTVIIPPLETNGSHEDSSNIWMEGVGSPVSPLVNVLYSDWSGNYDSLISCSVGDEVLYYNPNIIDGVTPDDSEVKKNTIDFTHVVKTQPKAPRSLSPSPSPAGEGSEGSELTGEYSLKELFVNFKPLAGPYVITICDDSGTEVYRKEVQTSNVIGLNTDISGYSKGEYTITVENEEEAYTAKLSIDEEVGIGRPTPDPSRDGGEQAGAVYDLSGRKVIGLSLPSLTGEGLGVRLPRGIYIRDGRKVVVR